MIKKIINYLKQADYKTYFIISWIFSYWLVNFFIGVRYEKIGIWGYQPFTVIILSFTYLYSHILNLSFKCKKEGNTVLFDFIYMSKVVLKIMLFFMIMDWICKFSYNNGLDIWFLWGIE